MRHSFEETLTNGKYKPIGKTYVTDSEVGYGIYWVYTKKDFYSIVIHDIKFNKDSYLEIMCPEYFSISYYISISGEEFTPYADLSSGEVKCFYKCNEKYQAIYHKEVPVKIISIEILPNYINKFLSENYPNEFINLTKAIVDIKSTFSFPEMKMLLHDIYSYVGSGMEAQLFYDGKVAEALSLVLHRHNYSKSYKLKYNISNSDFSGLQNAAQYIDNHYSFDIPLEILSKIACMGPTKFKSTFKYLFGYSVTEYIQRVRIRKAEHLLISTDLTIKAVSKSVGYNNPSRFSELFKRVHGIFPSEYKVIKLNIKTDNVKEDLL